MKLASAVIALLSALATTTNASYACTTACFQGRRGPIITKSYDWHTSEGLVIVNKAGVRKSAFTLGTDKPAEWTSKYASITFNQYGREMPNGGMNTAGLVVEVMWLAETETPPPDARPSISELQWIQYQLDNCSNIGEVIRSAPRLRVDKIYGAVHYLACDKAGACAALEYLRGKLVVTTGDRLTAPVLANDTYERSQAYLKTHRGFGGTQSPQHTARSLDRFTRAADYNRQYAGQATVTGGFKLLDRVSQGQFTVWQLVYEPQALLAHFRTRDQRHIKTIDLRQIDPSCAAPVQVFDMNSPLMGDVSRHTQTYQVAHNRRLISRSLSKLRGMPSFLQLVVAGYPEQTTCLK